MCPGHGNQDSNISWLHLIMIFLFCESTCLLIFHAKTFPHFTLTVTWANWWFQMDYITAGNGSWKWNRVYFKMLFILQKNKTCESMWCETKELQVKLHLQGTKCWNTIYIISAFSLKLLSNALKCKNGEEIYLFVCNFQIFFLLRIFSSARINFIFERLHQLA